MAASATGIELTAKLFLYPLSFLNLLFKPTIEIDGQPTRGIWQKPQFLAVPAGNHTFSVYWKYLGFLKCNRATLQVQVVDGQVTQVLYNTRWLVYLPGKIAIVTAPPAAAA
jgi:hypothetical protein